jgi:hypothetical protein
MRKKLAIIIIGLMLINILSFIRPVQANPAAVLMGPGVYYAIAGGLTACGLYAADSEALQYIVNDYWNKQEAYNREQWSKAVQYGVIAGKIVVNANMTRSLIEYLDLNYTAGHNKKTGTLPVEPGYRYVTVDGWNLFAGQRTGCSNGIYAYKGNTWNYLTFAAGASYIPLDERYAKFIAGSYFYIVGDTIRVWLSWDGTDHEVATGISQGATGEGVVAEYVGDSAGFGAALAPDQEVKVPCPPVPEIDWPESWIDDLERWMNEADNPSIDDETIIEEGEDDWDWYVDKDTGEIYKRKKGEGPRKDDDRKIGFPVPVPEPNVPDDFPDIDNPDETTTEYPPETEIINNPDGTTTEKTVQHTDTTRRYYDPETKKWKETTTTTTTTTETTFDPDGLPLGPPTVTVTTGPPTTETTNPPTDDTGIDWQPLKRGASTITRKFPFSLPWDFYNSFKQLDGGAWDGKLDINIDTKLADFVFEIDLGMFDAIRNIVKRIELLLFDVGLILATRRLMGGGV